MPRVTNGSRTDVLGIEAIQNMPSSRILRSLDFGAMMTIAYQLNRADEVARYLGKPGGDPRRVPRRSTRDRSVALNTSTSPIWNGWSPSTKTRASPRRAGEAVGGADPEAEAEMGIRVRGDISAFFSPL